MILLLFSFAVAVDEVSYDNLNFHRDVSECDGRAIEESGKLPVSIQKCTFANVCESKGDGGAVLLKSTSEIWSSITDSVFARCRSNEGRGGAIFLALQALAGCSIKQCCATECWCQRQGGFVGAERTAVVTHLTTTYICGTEGRTAGEGRGGGYAVMDSRSIEFKFSNNTRDASTGEGSVTFLSRLPDPSRIQYCILNENVGKNGMSLVKVQNMISQYCVFFSNNHQNQLIRTDSGAVIMEFCLLQNNEGNSGNLESVNGGYFAWTSCVFADGRPSGDYQLIVDQKNVFDKQGDFQICNARRTLDCIMVFQCVTGQFTPFPPGFESHDGTPSAKHSTDSAHIVPQKKGMGKPLIAAIASVVGILGIIALVITILLIKRRNRQKSVLEESEHSNFHEDEEGFDATQDNPLYPEPQTLNQNFITLDNEAGAAAAEVNHPTI
jgi:hypothetical protein